jgi:hypothetical protein
MTPMTQLARCSNLAEFNTFLEDNFSAVDNPKVEYTTMMGHRAVVLNKGYKKETYLFRDIVKKFLGLKNCRDEDYAHLLPKMFKLLKTIEKAATEQKDLNFWGVTKKLNKVIVKEYVQDIQSRINRCGQLDAREKTRTLEGFCDHYNQLDGLNRLLYHACKQVFLVDLREWQSFYVKTSELLPKQLPGWQDMVDMEVQIHLDKARQNTLLMLMPKWVDIVGLNTVVSDFTKMLATTSSKALNPHVNVTSRASSDQEEKLGVLLELVKQYPDFILAFVNKQREDASHFSQFISEYPVWIVNDEQLDHLEKLAHNNKIFEQLSPIQEVALFLLATTYHEEG